jgi:hypothetical protein
MAVEALTVESLEDHRSTVHCYESFERTVAELMIQEAKRILLAGERDTESSAVEFKADVTVSSVGPPGSLGVEVCVPSIGCSKVHIDLR